MALRFSVMTHIKRYRQKSFRGTQTMQEPWWVKNAQKKTRFKVLDMKHLSGNMLGIFLQMETFDWRRQHMSAWWIRAQDML